MSWQEWFDLVYKASVGLGHFWSTMLGPETLSSIPEPKSENDLREILRYIEREAKEGQHPGPAGWGVTSPNLFWVGSTNVRVAWYHETMRRRLCLSGEWGHPSISRICALVQRPYPWQQYCFKLVVVAAGANHWFAEIVPPIGGRHYEVIKDLCGAFGIVPPDAPVVDDEELARTDAEALIRYYTHHEA